MGSLETKTLISISIAWLAFVLLLDFYYEMFPQVSGGGLKILASAWALYFLVITFVRLIRTLVRWARSGTQN